MYDSVPLGAGVVSNCTEDAEIQEALSVASEKSESILNVALAGRLPKSGLELGFNTPRITYGKKT